MLQYEAVIEAAASHLSRVLSAAFLTQSKGMRFTF